MARKSLYLFSTDMIFPYFLLLGTMHTKRHLYMWICSPLPLAFIKLNSSPNRFFFTSKRFPDHAGKNLTKCNTESGLSLFLTCLSTVKQLPEAGNTCCFPDSLSGKVGHFNTCVVKLPITKEFSTQSRISKQFHFSSVAPASMLFISMPPLFHWGYTWTLWFIFTANILRCSAHTDSSKKLIQPFPCSNYF